MGKPIVVDHGVYTRDNPYGYTFNVNHPMHFKYCGNCGARLIGVEDDDENEEYEG